MREGRIQFPMAATLRGILVPQGWVSNPPSPYTALPALAKRGNHIQS